MRFTFLGLTSDGCSSSNLSKRHSDISEDRVAFERVIFGIWRILSNPSTAAMATKPQERSKYGSSRRPDTSMLLLLLAARAINALAVKTFFQPDEYFQSLEPAWQAAFGHESGAWITWV